MKKILALSLTAIFITGSAISADAKQTRSMVHSNMSVHSDNSRNTTSLRYSNRMDRPRGWSQGRKRGWDCTVGSRDCVPPGQQKWSKRSRWSNDN